MMELETVIGLEIHVELKTSSKMFCGCANDFGGEPNTKTCPVCLGLPGVLPVVNRRAVELATRFALALGCEIAPYSIFHRKNYFYPDMPKNFQISQYDLPLGVGGHVDLDMGDYIAHIGVTRVHLEEDTGKSIHVGESGRIHGAEYSLEDFNRAGVPLMEIVSEPDIRSAAEARAYVAEIKSILEHLDVSDCKMEEGSLRCDANISLRPVGATEFGVKAEVKNMNSLRALYRALDYEEKRQREMLVNGEEVAQETRHWDEGLGVTQPMRSKEFAFDYRYFPEPDLVPLELGPEFVDPIRAAQPELPAQRRERLAADYGLPAQDIASLTASRAAGDYFEKGVTAGADPKAFSNWMMGDLSAYLNTHNLEFDQVPLTPEQLAEMLSLIGDGTISGKIAKSVFEEMLATGKDARSIVEAAGMTQISDEDELRAVVARVVEANPRSVDDFRAGKDKAVGFLVGQVMKETRGRANPALVNELIQAALQG